MGLFSITVVRFLTGESRKMPNPHLARTTEQEDTTLKTSSYFRIKLARRSRWENFKKAFNK